MSVEDLPWWKKGIVYEILVRSFADSDNDGIGDIRGIIERLDHLNDGTPRSLGVDAIWLSPFYRSPMVDCGYDVADYYSVDPAYGRMSDFDELLSECHRRGIKVIIDMILNHTSDEHAWFAESRSSRDDPKRDWYIWRDGRAPGKPPNRWKAVVEGSAWVFDEMTGQYYYHAFLPQQPDLNWRNPEVRKAMFDVCRFWLDRGVDGFRLDLVNFLHEDERLRDNPRKVGWRTYEMQRHLYDRSQPEDHEVVRELRGMLDSYPGTMMVGEVYTDTSKDAADYYGRGDDELHLSFYLDFAEAKWSAESFRRSVDDYERMMPKGAWPCYYLSNHDLVRHVTRLGKHGDAGARARVAAVMMLTLRGTPFLYCGEEIGMPQGRIPRQRLKDPIGIKWWPVPVGRDGERTPMQWSSERFGGFSEVEPWLPVDGSYTRTNVASQDSDPGSLLNLYRRLAWLRRDRPSLHAGDYRPLDVRGGGVFAYARELGEERVAVFLNFKPGRVVLEPGSSGLGEGPWRLLLSTRADRVTGAEVGAIELGPDEALVLERA